MNCIHHDKICLNINSFYIFFSSSLFRAVLKAHQSMCLLSSPLFPLTFFSYTSSLPLSASFPHPSFLSLFFLISLPYLSLSPSLTLLSSHFFFLISLPYLSLSPTIHPSISLFQLKKVIADGLAQAGSAAAEVTEICLSGGKR